MFQPVATKFKKKSKCTNCLSIHCGAIVLTTLKEIVNSKTVEGTTEIYSKGSVFTKQKGKTTAAISITNLSYCV